MSIIYDSTISNDFNGSKSVSTAGFTDVKGGVAAISSGKLVLTPDSIDGGSDAFLRDFVVRLAEGEAMRDAGLAVTLPANYRGGDSTVGIVLRYQETSKNCYLANFAPNNTGGSQLSIYKIVAGAVTSIVTPINLQGIYNSANPVFFEALAVLNPCIVAVRVTDLVTGLVIGYLEAAANNEPTLASEAGGMGVVTWVAGSTIGSISVSAIRTYTATVVLCAGDSLTASQYASEGYNSENGTGGAQPVQATYPGVLSRLLGGSFYVVNAGVSGATQAQINSSANGSDSALASAQQQPIVIIQGGTNDLGDDPTLGGGSGGYSLSAASAAIDTYGRLQTYWSSRESASYNNGAETGFRCVAVTLTPAQHPVYTSNLGSASAFDARRDALNTLILSGNGSGARPALVANVAANLAIGTTGDELNAIYFNSSDFTHMTDAGYALKAQLIYSALFPAPQPYLWFVIEPGGGSIDAMGNYIAPATEGTYHIVAVSVADPTQVGIATVEVN